MVTIALVMCLIAVGFGVCAWTDAIDGIWPTAVTAAIMVAVGTILLPMPDLPTSEQQRYFAFRLGVTALVAAALNTAAILIGRVLERRRSQ